VIEGGGALPRIYANALFQLAREADVLDERLYEVRALLDVFAERPGFRRVIESPKVKHERKVALVGDVFGDRFSRDLRNLVLLLIEKSRQYILTAVLEAFVELCDEEMGRLPARLTTAVPIRPEDGGRLVADLSKKVGKEIVLAEEVDPSLLGGAVLRFGDFLVDGSLKTRVRNMREELLKPSEARGG